MPIRSPPNLPLSAGQRYKTAPLISILPHLVFSPMTTSVPIENADTVRAAAATIIWDNLARRISARDATAAALRVAVMAVYGISWNRAVITALTTNRINDVLPLLKRYTSFPAREYTRLADFLKESYSVSADFPPELLAWRQLAQQLRLELSHGWDAVLSTALFLQVQGTLSPSNLGVLSPAEFQLLTGTSPHPQMLRVLRSVTRPADDLPSTPHTYLMPPSSSYREGFPRQSSEGAYFTAG